MIKYLGNLGEGGFMLSLVGGDMASHSSEGTVTSGSEGWSVRACLVYGNEQGGGGSRWNQCAL